MKKIIIGSSLIFCTILYIIEQVLEVNYGIKTGAKWVLFIGMPLLLNHFIKKEKKEKQVDKKGILLGLLFGIISFSVIVVAYIFLKEIIDFNSIVTEMKTKSKITPENFIFIAIYVTFGNSLVEEFFFRGYIFLNLYQEGKKKIAYIYSSGLFSVYHLAIFQSWFEWHVMVLALFGLFVIGFIFSWLNTKTNTFFNSWIVHILADTAIVLIGFKLFGLF